MIRRSVFIICFTVLVLRVHAEPGGVAQQLIERSDFESKRAFYLASPLTLDEVRALLNTTTEERERVELLLFYLQRQFHFDISIGRDQAREAVDLARKLNLKTHESIALSNLATASCLFVPSQTAHQYADSAIMLSKEAEDYAFTSSIYYTKYVIDLVNEDAVSGVKNLLKCVELAEQYAAPVTRNERRLRLLRFATQNAHPALAISLQNRLEKEELGLENQLMFLIWKGKLQDLLGNIDSSKNYYRQAVELRMDFETTYALGEWYRNNDMLDSAIYFLNKSVSLTDPRRSYIGDKYLILADIYEEQGDLNLAEDYLKKRLAESLRLMEKFTEALNYVELAQFYLRQAQLDSASQYANQSYQLAKTYGFNSSIYEATKTLSAIAEKRGNFIEANKYLKEQLAQEQLNSEQEIAAQLKKAEMDRNLDDWVQVGEEKVKRAEQLRNFIVVLTVLLLLLLVSVLNTLKNKRKALRIQKELNQKVMEQRDKIAEQREGLKAMNQDLTLTNDELEKKVAERTHEIKDAHEKLTQYSARLEEYANITAHNLRGPLANIVGLANIYDSGHMTAQDNHKAIGLIAKSAAQIDEVMRELNTLLDVEQTRRMKIEKINMSEMIADLEQWIREKAKKTEISFNGRTTLHEVYSEKTYLERTLRELLINSYHYRDEERALNINLTVEDKPGLMEIKVEDNGLGIDLEKYGNQIFMLNQRFHERNGRGVGLYLAKRQVEAMQGTISVVSEPGMGSCFTVSLPY